MVVTGAALPQVLWRVAPFAHSQVQITLAGDGALRAGARALDRRVARTQTALQRWWPTAGYRQPHNHMAAFLGGRSNAIASTTFLKCF